MCIASRLAHPSTDLLWRRAAGAGRVHSCCERVSQSQLLTVVRSAKGGGAAALCVHGSGVLCYGRPVFRQFHAKQNLPPLLLQRPPCAGQSALLPSPCCWQGTDLAARGVGRHTLALLDLGAPLLNLRLLGAQGAAGYMEGVAHSVGEHSLRGFPPPPPSSCSDPAQVTPCSQPPARAHCPAPSSTTPDSCCPHRSCASSVLIWPATESACCARMPSSRFRLARVAALDASPPLPALDPSSAAWASCGAQRVDACKYMALHAQAGSRAHKPSSACMLQRGRSLHQSPNP